MKGFKRAAWRLLQSFSRVSNRPPDLVKGVERVTGIEPAWPAWKAGALPLSYTRGTVGENAWETRSLPVSHPADRDQRSPRFWSRVARGGSRAREGPRSRGAQPGSPGAGGN